MALKARNQVKTVFGVADLTLTAHPGESFLVTGIKIYSAAGTFATLKIEKTTVGYFRIDPTYGNHLSFHRAKTLAGVVGLAVPKNLIQYLIELGIFKGYPVAEGESFVVQGAANAADVKTVQYDIFDGEDHKATDPNGSKATEYLMIAYGDTGAVIDAAGDSLLDNPLTPAEFPRFPFAAEVPSKSEILVHGILGSEVAVCNATPALAIHTKYLKLVKDREVLFDEDRNGIPFDASATVVAEGVFFGHAHSLVGGFSTMDPRPPLMFPEPILFDQGDELNAYITAVEPVAASSIALLNQVIGFIQTVRRKGAA